MNSITLTFKNKEFESLYRSK